MKVTTIRNFFIGSCFALFLLDLAGSDIQTGTFVLVFALAVLYLGEAIRERQAVKVIHVKAKDSFAIMENEPR